MDDFASYEGSSGFLRWWPKILLGLAVARRGDPLEPLAAVRDRARGVRVAARPHAAVALLRARRRPRPRVPVRSARVPAQADHDRAHRDRGRGRDDRAASSPRLPPARRRALRARPARAAAARASTSTATASSDVLGLGRPPTSTSASTTSRAAIDFYERALDAEFVWHFRRFGTEVAAVRVSDDGPQVLLAEHRPTPSCLPIWTVPDLDALGRTPGRGRVRRPGRHRRHARRPGPRAARPRRQRARLPPAGPCPTPWSPATPTRPTTPWSPRGRLRVHTGAMDEHRATRDVVAGTDRRSGRRRGRHRLAGRVPGGGRARAGDAPARTVRTAWCSSVTFMGCCSRRTVTGLVDAATMGARGVARRRRVLHRAVGGVPGVGSPPVRRVVVRSDGVRARDGGDERGRAALVGCVDRGPPAPTVPVARRSRRRQLR